jgi:N-acetylglucosaminyl-diphospho-decaprenol L-rhamnosyltransferase
MASQPQQLSIIIINYHSSAFTKQCLRTVTADEVGRCAEVIVIDNASYDGCKELLDAEYPWVKFVQCERNLGFAGANNLGVGLSQGQHLLFLNPDTELREGALRKLLATLESKQDAGMVGCRLLNTDLSLQTSCITSFPTVVNQILGTDYLRQTFPRAGLWGIRALYESGNEPKIVDAISGACILARREVIEQVHGFTTDYFMYAEDVDLCLKVKKLGWHIYYVPDAEIVHHGGKSSNRRQESNYAAVMIRESMFCFMSRNYGAGHAWLFRGLTAAVSAGRLFLFAALLPAAVLHRVRRKLYAGSSKWLGILSWSLGFKNWAKRESQAMSDTPHRLGAGA